MPPSTRGGLAGGNVSHPGIKRRRSSSPIYISSAPVPGARAAGATGTCPSCASAGTRTTTTTTSTEARQQLFDALEKGDRFAAMKRNIASAEHLTEVQLARCFDILHACGRATDDQATLATTRQSVDGFLEAVFQDWSSEAPGELLRPELEFMVDAEVVAGRICVTETRQVTYALVPSIVSPSHHNSISYCTAADPACTVEVAASATYSSNPAMLKQEFLTTDPFTRQPEAACLMGRGDVRWVSTDWRATLRETLLSKVVAKAAKFNKHLAIWKARRLVVAWSKGSIEMGLGGGAVGGGFGGGGGAEAGEDVAAGFAGRGQAELALMCMGA
ncbi:Clavaminate synthase-like protein [Purpureocillium lavendulum]|uniref:Clavaminate synthase-like protein n=1 Tax=Purpureocillium lavendulum TaxID=1247861 RepID=A0AB34FQH3_9HYPO|nr:Clavaminate synthase-like protein [Purpureocillium lavendulum]